MTLVTQQVCIIDLKGGNQIAMTSLLCGVVALATAVATTAGIIGKIFFVHVTAAAVFWV